MFLCLLAEVPDERVIVWVSDLKEAEARPSALAAYGKAIRAADEAGRLPLPSVVGSSASY